MREAEIASPLSASLARARPWQEARAAGLGVWDGLRTEAWCPEPSRNTTGQEENTAGTAPAALVLGIAQRGSGRLTFEGRREVPLINLQHDGQKLL